MILGSRIGLIGSVLALLCTVPAGTVGAATCNVPSPSHPTLRAAVEDVGCTDIVVAAGTFTEVPVIARDLAIQGAGSSRSFVHGQVQVTAGAVSLGGLHISAAADALWVHSGAQVAGFDLEVVDGDVEPSLFADGFESGGTGAWSGVAP